MTLETMIKRKITGHVFKDKFLLHSNFTLNMLKTFKRIKVHEIKAKPQ